MTFSLSYIIVTLRVSHDVAAVHLHQIRFEPEAGLTGTGATRFCQAKTKIWWDKDTDYFFMAPDHTMISPNTIYGKFRVYLKVMRISHGGKGQGPRLHDLRHYVECF